MYYLNEHLQSADLHKVCTIPFEQSFGQYFHYASRKKQVFLQVT